MSVIEIGHNLTQNYEMIHYHLVWTLQGLYPSLIPITLSRTRLVLDCGFESLNNFTKTTRLASGGDVLKHWPVSLTTRLPHHNQHEQQDVRSTLAEGTAGFHGTQPRPRPRFRRGLEEETTQSRLPCGDFTDHPHTAPDTNGFLTLAGAGEGVTVAHAAHSREERQVGERTTCLHWRSGWSTQANGVRIFPWCI